MYSYRRGHCCQVWGHRWGWGRCYDWGCWFGCAWRRLIFPQIDPCENPSTRYNGHTGQQDQCQFCCTQLYPTDTGTFPSQVSWSCSKAGSKCKTDGVALRICNLIIKQAGAELCQAQGKLKLVWLWLTFGFANFAHEFNFGALLLFLWKFWVGLVGVVW